ncbi:2-furoyl-CoA dehydrogenase 2Fe-2S iron sulfur subunit [Loktanella sp. DSM 29012]|uniref:(2Fe-2S)-binding protein n=1 Tax=Loktanella sp. DSM 29012 TaxID=1881056 RepID=UPI0008BB624E|nr:(2Fe-2S)-binding protein [Loktanella sp. DSM 29012]SEQ87110.1 2-furoyl-CoA dehydrogenase 2Fe-2S iron sulfur subunit [Loktanella sp. DSM 29012]
MPRLTKDDVQPVGFKLNGRPVVVRVTPRTLLTDALRHEIGATGTHVGCEHGVCGACTVQVDGEPARACLMLAHQADGCDIRTVEGLAQGDALTPLQEAFRAHFALQCGFCTAGILMTLDALFSRQPDADEDAIREALSGHLCRCTGYAPIVQAALTARNRIKGGPIDA